MDMQDETEFQSALQSVLGAGPTAGQSQHALAKLRASARGWSEAIWYGGLAESRIGPLLIAVGPRGLLAIGFGPDQARFVERLEKSTGAPVWPSQERVAAAIEQLSQYLEGQRREFELPIDLSLATAFQRKVLQAAERVPAGVVATYGEIARRIGRPRAARAVGQALARNPIPIVVPCHRVVAADGSLTGYSGGAGVETKRQLLALEGATLA